MEEAKNLVGVRLGRRKMAIPAILFLLAGAAVADLTDAHMTALALLAIAMSCAAVATEY